MQETDKIILREEPKLLDYYLSMADNFSLFRMFLADDIDAIIVHLIDNGEVSLRDLIKIDKGFLAAIEKFALRYPSKVPIAESADVLIPDKLKYSIEDKNCIIVHNLMRILIHLKAATSAIISSVK